MARCGMCFKDKDLTRVSPKTGNIVCKGCWYEIDRVVGYMESIDYSFQYKLSEVQDPHLTDPNGAKPPKPPSKRASRAKATPSTPNGSNPR